MAATLAGPVGVASAKSCSGLDFKYRGTPWHARDVHAKRTSCRTAHSLIRSYAHPRNCRFIAPCHLGKWTCRTYNAHGSQFDERCTRGRKRVRWHGSYKVS